MAPAKKGQTSSSMTQRVADSGMDSGPLLSGVDATLSRKRFPLKRNVWQWRSGYRLPKEPAEQKSSAAEFRLEVVEPTRGEHIRHAGRDIQPTSTAEHRDRVHRGSADDSRTGR